MKLNELDILTSLTHPIDLLDEEQFFNYLELEDKAPAQAQSILDRALINYYKSVRPSAVAVGNSNEEILKYGISSYVMSLITEHSVSRYLIQHHIVFDALGGSYDTIEEQYETYGLPDFSYRDGTTLEVKSTSKLTFSDWFASLIKYDCVWKLHNADSILLFASCSYSRTTNTFKVGNIYLGKKDENTYIYEPVNDDASLELKENIAKICAEVGIKSKI